MTPTEILMKHEDANEYHFHEVDRKWIIEAMEEYATISKRETVDKEKSVIPINLYTEEQVKAMIDMAHNGYDGYYDIISPFAPIYIPDNNDLKEISKHEILYNNAKRDWWLEGANYILHILKLQLDGQDD